MRALVPRQSDLKRAVLNHMRNLGWVLTGADVNRIHGVEKHQNKTSAREQVWNDSQLFRVNTCHLLHTVGSF